MHSHRLRVGLSFIVGLGCWFGKVHAQAPANAPLTPPVAPTTIIVSVENAEAERPAQVQAGAQGPTTHESGNRKGDWLRRHGFACGQNLNWYGCGGWHAQNQFVFGSCRTFMREPCLPNQPRERGGACASGCAK